MSQAVDVTAPSRVRHRREMNTAQLAAVAGGSRVREVGVDYVILVHEDPDGVESVRLHRLDRR